MKISELIEELSKYHPNAPVYIPTGKEPGVCGRVAKVVPCDDQMGGDIIQILPYNFD